MSPIDLLFFSILLIFGLLGYVSGLWRQIARLGVMLLAYLLAWPLGSWSAPWLTHTLSFPHLIARPVAIGISFFLLYSVLSGIVLRLLRKRRKARLGTGSQLGRSVNKLGGAVLGMAKAAIICLFILCLAVLMESGLKEKVKQSLGYKRSFMVSFAKKINPLKNIQLPLVGDFKTLRKIKSDPDFRIRMAQDPKVRAFAGHKKIQSLLHDRSFQKAAQSQDISSLLSHPRLNEALQDPEVYKLYKKIDLSKVK
jgi:uncharacterized membrane protein required for colicin V production